MRCLCLLLMAGTALLGCGRPAPEPRHPRLLGFKAETLAQDIDDANYRRLHLARRLRTETITQRRLDDILYLRLVQEVNACGRYVGNLRIHGDTLYLRYEQTAEEVCASSRVDQLTYLVDNPQRRRYKVVFQL